MAAPLLLVADDLALIAMVKRALAKDGYELVLATSAADALIAFGHHLPRLVILQPTVERDRGNIVLEELEQHPDTQLLRVLILGETIPGFAYPVEPLPIDPKHFAGSVRDAMRGSDGESDWEVSANTRPSPTPHPPPPQEPEPWRATRQVPTQAPTAELSDDLADRLFSDLPAFEDEMARDVEAQAMASLESSLPQAAADGDLAELEAEVRAEANRRRAVGETTRGVAPVVVPAPPTVPTPRSERARGTSEPGSSPSQVAMFEELDDAALDQELSGVALGDESPPTEPELSSEKAVAEPAAAPPGLRWAGHETGRPEAALATSEESAAAPRGPSEAPEDLGLDSNRSHAHGVDGDAADPRAHTLTPPDVEGEPSDPDAFETTPTAPMPSPQRPTALPPESAPRVLLRAHSLRAEARAAFFALETERTQALEQSTHRALQAERLLQAEQEARLHIDAQLQATHAEGSERIAELERLLRDYEAALTTEQQRSESFEVAHAESQSARETLEAQQRESAAKIVQLSSELDRSAALTRTRAESAASLELELSAAVQAKEALAVAQRTLMGELDGLRQRLARVEREAIQAQIEQQTAREAERLETEEREARLENERRRLEAALTTQRAATDAQQREAERLEQLLAETERAAGLSADEAADTSQALERRLQVAHQEVTAAHTQLKSLSAETEAMRGELNRVTAELTQGRERQASLVGQLASRESELESYREQAETVERQFEEAGARIKVLEERAVMPLALPGRQAIGVPRTNTVDLEGLARLMAQLVLANAEVQLELGVEGGSRTLWLRKGTLVAAESTLTYESLVEQARREGLIDSRQEAELRMLRGATAREQLDVLKARGFIRDAEAVPLVQRYTEHLALEALTEGQTLYRLSEQVPDTTVLSATVPRATLPLVADAVRRGLPAEGLLELLGGGEATAIPLESELDLRALSFSERERKMLSWADAETTVEDLTLASGLKPELAYRALAVAKVLGVLELRKPNRPPPKVTPELEVRRLESKYDEVQDADYFSILGLPKNASGDDVRRAHERLSQEFDPLKFSGHADPSLQQRAQAVASLIDEAARALSDERQRIEYARHLLD